ncbi:MAG: Rrf2 family transcriptional regulator [Spirochaetia bacterium]|jgi:Rrf2 family protein
MITRSGTHALKAMAYLASLPVGAYEGAGEIALQIKAPQNYLGKLLRLLARAGLLEGRKGSNGGFRLARDSGNISLYDVLEPIEHVSRIKGCALGRAQCTRKDHCALHEGWARIRNEYLGFLRNTRLSEVAD